MNTKRTILVLLGVVAILVVGVLGGAFAFRLGPWADTEASATESPPLDLGAVIAKVDGNPVYMYDAVSRFKGLSTVHSLGSGPLGEDWHQQVFESLVNDQIIREEAKARGITATEEDMQRWMDQIGGMLAEGQTVDDWLAEQGITQQDLERRIELQILGTRVYVAVTKDVKVSGKEIRDYYRENPVEFQEADGSTTPLLEVRKSLRQSLLKDEQNAAYHDWLTERRDEVDVEVVMKDWWKELS
jgi:hypothetical protein